MRSVTILLIIITVAGFGSLAQQKTADSKTLKPSNEKPTGSPVTFTIYPGDGVPPGSHGSLRLESTIPTPEGRMTRNVSIPTLTMYQPAKGNSNGTALIVAPGGAFYFLMMDKEGADVGKWLTKLGVTAFVLKYRVAETPEGDSALQPFLTKLFEVLPHPDANAVDPPIGTEEGEKMRLLSEEDGRQAIRYIRSNATQFGINPNRIGIMGFSAGGGVAVNVAMEHDKQSRPDFAAGIYPGWRMGPSVGEGAPPLFLAISDKDALVGPVSSARLYEAWHKAGGMVELHIFANGEHGFGARKKNTLSDAWTVLFSNWLKAQGLLVPLK